MDLFIRNVPVAATTRHIEDIFYRPLAEYNIKNFHATKLGEGPLAKITILDAAAGKRFIADHNLPRLNRTRKKIHWGGRDLAISESRDKPSELALQSLQEASGGALSTTQHIEQRNALKINTRFAGGQLECGRWDYVNEKLTFISHTQDYRNGTITIGRSQAIIILGSSEAEQCQIDVNYYDCEDIVLGSSSIIFNLRFAPKIYMIKGDEAIDTLLQRLMLGTNRIQSSGQKTKIRLSAMSSLHASVAGACWTYRFTLSDRADLRSIRNLLGKKSRMCSVHLFDAITQTPDGLFSEDFKRLQRQLIETNSFGSKPFPLRFQLDRLARNGYLTPSKVSSLLSTVASLHDEFGLQPILSALRRVSRNIPFAGPETDPVDLSTGTLEKSLQLHCTQYDPSALTDPYELAKRYAHVNLIHKLVVTPSGLRLEGPEPEPTNRVLRSYAYTTDAFVRVEFRDDDGAAVRYEPRTDLSRIYHERFKGFLDSNVYICGYAFSFLGFSHSSLRSQSCWFMRPFIDINDRNLVLAEVLLKRLGDFASIRTPAKCAARIGQNFTDTNASVDIDVSELYDLPLVQRNGRDFGDGVGTISFDLLEQVHRVYGSRRMLKPTALQIRFQGAKGMVALDSTLRGKKLCLRSNMVKFPVGTQATWNLEVCGAAFKPLPMVLNRQFIKLFEDLGVPVRVFMDLQNRFKEKLTKMTLSAINTATFLEDTESPSATRLPSLIRYIGQVGLDYHADPFLYSVVEMLVVSKLREIKYKGRIPVEDGVTLYGIMDETGFLKEREIYVVTEKAPRGGKRVIVCKNVVVTRSPAMHPGDVQVVDAVDVPADSPLADLRNVVVFSQHGDRDIPSMLSGGDLDGDLYNVIWLPELVPAITYAPADYPKVPPIELDRIVRSKDMSDFFVTFMENDRLGMICTAHLQIADQKPAGTIDPDCIKLSNMASTAVDFSKTGVPMTEQMPRYQRLRPDFMAPSPRVSISPSGFLDTEDIDEEEDVAFDGIDSEKPRTRYYTSQKALGHLFRNIDERHFVAKMQQRQRGASTLLGGKGPTVMMSLFEYAKHWATQYSVFYTHHNPLARQIRKAYDESMVTILHDYEPMPHSPLSETEAFAGQIVGRQGGLQDKPLKDLAKTMRERFNTLVEHATMRITKGDEAMQEVDDLDVLYDDTHYDERELEALPRALACLEVAVSESGYRDAKLGELRSFGYVALSVLLRELDRYRVTTFGSMSGLPRA